MTASTDTLDTTTASFQRWLKGATPGDSYTYHRGVLVRDRVAKDREDSDEIDRLGSAVFRAYERGLVDIAQKRHSAGDYSYIAVRRQRGRTPEKEAA